MKRLIKKIKTKNEAKILDECTKIGDKTQKTNKYIPMNGNNKKMHGWNLAI